MPVSTPAFSGVSRLSELDRTLGFTSLLPLGRVSGSGVAARPAPWLALQVVNDRQAVRGPGGLKTPENTGPEPPAPENCL